MRKWLVILVLAIGVASCASMMGSTKDRANSLRELYSKDPSQWPAPLTAPGIVWKELGILPAAPIKKDSLSNLVELGKKLFFDTRLSGSGKISCATCHQPELHWTDGKQKSVGHEGALSKRNSPTIQNSWFYERLFWDGRSKDLQDQAFAPINSETEMHSEMPDVLRKLRAAKGYAPLFKQAFGSEDIGPDEFTAAIAAFERTIVSRESRFDEFIKGNKKVLSDGELNGLHLFRTRAGCMNCHHGPLFSDNLFHANGLFHPGGDKGYYMVSHKDADIGKFKTPSLRDVAFTGPWMHDGSYNSLNDILVIYSEGGLVKHDPLVQRTGLNKWEIRDLVAFLHAISAPPPDFQKPILPD